MTAERDAATTESREENRTMLMWDVERRRVVQVEPGERDPGLQSLGAMPLWAVDGFLYTGPLRTTRDLMIRRLPHARWAVDFDYKATTNGEGFYWKHGHVEAQWLGDALAAAGEIALRAADYSEKWAAGSLA